MARANPPKQSMKECGQSMTYKVIITPLAESDLEDYTDFIAQDSPERAQKWLREAWQLIFSLQELPNRFEQIPEAEELGEPLRDALHYSHRIVYRIDEQNRTVEIIRVWHSARSTLTSQNI
jgi:toxin ParE1/3/4